MADIFEQLAASREESPGRLERARLFVAQVLREAPPGSRSRVLDFGCGTGLVVLQLAPEDGRFHSGAMEAPHKGFVPADLASVFLDAGFTACTARFHNTFIQEDASGEAREYKQFLLVADR